MTKKQKKWLIRIGIAAALFVLLLIGKHTGLFDRLTAGLPEFWKTAVPLAFAVVTYLIAGYDVLIRAGKNIIHGKIFDENFLMVLATIGAFAIGEFEEAAAVMIFYQVGEWFQSYAVGKSRQSISELMSIAPEYANVETDGEIEEVDPEDVAVGTVIVVKPGEKVPLDGVIVEGESTVDTSSLTGESVPVCVAAGQEIISGSVNLSGVLRVQTTKLYEDSTVSRILELVENASSRKAPVENFITKFARYYTPAVTIAAVLLAIVMPLLTDGNFAEWIRRACSFLVISCPCALVISVPLGFFGGIGAASKIGVLVKGSNYLEALSKVRTIAFDKTGTLTKGTFTVTGIHTAAGVTEAEVLRIAAIAERYSNHPVAEAIRKAAGESAEAEAAFSYEELSGRGVIARCGDRVILAGNEKLLSENKVPVEACNSVGTVVYVAENGAYLGTIVISDSVKEGAKAALETMKKAGIRETVMLTGDRREAAEYVAGAVGIDTVKAGLLPGDKITALEEFMSPSPAGSASLTAFVGDGINDAPVLMRADVGLAMGALGSDAAIEAADIVLMDDDLAKIAQTVQISRKTLRIVHENIAIALGVKFVVLCLGALGLAGMWLAMFADVGVAAICILNSMRALRVSRGDCSDAPDHPKNLPGEVPRR
ncbi:MAG: cadmium-translocating P-type ATPase [Lachnospiraceae bacterium]|nr:cadmium-translocating P-type ATPase [Lachnospiraceae bacterium]